MKEAATSYRLPQQGEESSLQPIASKNLRPSDQQLKGIEFCQQPLRTLEEDPCPVELSDETLALDDTLIAAQETPRDRGPS